MCTLFVWVHASVGAVRLHRQSVLVARHHAIISQHPPPGHEGREKPFCIHVSRLFSGSPLAIFNQVSQTESASNVNGCAVTTVRENLEAGEVLRDLTYVLGIGIKTKTHEAGPTLADFKSGLHGDYGQGAVDFEMEVPPESIDWVRFGAEILKTGCLTRFLGGANTV